MRQAIYPEREGLKSLEKLPQWTRLPSLCCQAAGGYPEWVDDLTVAWVLFYTAADLMDKVQDQDQPDPWWRDLGSGAALSVATGVYFSASLVLNELLRNPITRPSANEIIRDFYNNLLIMTSGQYRELIERVSTLEDYWEYAGAKSGVFFATACRCAARLAIDDQDLLNDFYQFGYHFGLLVQIHDDLDDIQPPTNQAAPGQKKEIARSLAVIYALSVLPPHDCKRLKWSLSKAPTDSIAAEEVVDILNRSNAALYLLTELERHRKLALDAIMRACKPSPAQETLISYLSI